MLYFTGACGFTGVTVSALRNSSLAYKSPWLILFGSFGFLLGTLYSNYDENWMIKNLLYAGFIGCTGLSLVPLINMYSMPIIYDALFATGITVGSLGAVAYNSPSEKFLKLGGPLAIGLGGLLGVSLLSIFFPSRALYNVWLYGGLAVFSLFVLYDT